LIGEAINRWSIFNEILPASQCSPGAPSLFSEKNTTGATQTDLGFSKAPPMDRGNDQKEAPRLSACVSNHYTLLFLPSFGLTS
jgi:hypothetical protein